MGAMGAEEVAEALKADTPVKGALHVNAPRVAWMPSRGIAPQRAHIPPPPLDTSSVLWSCARRERAHHRAASLGLRWGGRGSCLTTVQSTPSQ